ncbi:MULTISPECIES: alanine racemase [unclassified Achromobacter]|uniref:alanine racemase n=1 Tax=unclassified Achromobacter TaxID=2626865 RepID=UPI000B51B83A|nr:MULTISPECIES: alanine racemase [unclassified Achromobacter]OWT73729.1 alanine racemase [Achromobacter sp. HZ34]OWT79355.1 alanine racemase [Achromobacter sp. HZ28]
MTTVFPPSRNANALAPYDCPPADVPTPCLVVYEEALLHNLRMTAERCGGIERLMPHIKTHRASWVVARLIEAGVRAFKVATVTEARMVLDAGAPRVLWAYPTVNGHHLASFLSLARQHPQAVLGALIDSAQGLDAWRQAMGATTWPSNLSLHVDLDPGMGRTGAPIGPEALSLARGAAALGTLGTFGGWHVYDGHIHDRDIELRRGRVAEVAARLRAIVTKGRAGHGLSAEVIAGASYSFDLWPTDLATYVAPGSWAYSSDQHDIELAHLQWQPAAFVLATVISRHGERVTLDAGAKAISPDKLMADRFRWDSPIVMMNEEHVVVDGGSLAVGDRVMLLPRHACTTAYLYDQALVRTESGRWEIRAQLGSKR